MVNHFYQCQYCLTLSVVPGADKYDILVKPICGICDQSVNHLGHVAGDKLAKLEDRCPCDGRCTGATGPNCDCQCGGINHGSNRLVTVEITTGNIPKLLPGADHYEAGKARAIEYKQARQIVRDKLNILAGMERDQVRIPYTLFCLYKRAPGHLSAIHAKKNHKNRIKGLTELAKDLEVHANV